MLSNGVLNLRKES